MAQPAATNRDAPLVRSQRLSGPYFRLTFLHPEVSRQARPGQFVMIKAGTSADLPLRRPFSILGVDAEKGTFDIFLKAVGEGTRALAALSEGELAQCLGPLGQAFPLPEPDVETVMVAGGYGIAPFLFLAAELRAHARKGRVFYGGRTTADLQLQDDFEPFRTPLVLATEDGSSGVRGRVTAPLVEYLDGTSGRRSLYACGPDAMLEAVARVGEARGIDTRVSLDPWMGCGVGTCLGCVVKIQEAEQERAKYRCACTEGPVFDARTVVWHGETMSFARRASGAKV